MKRIQAAGVIVYYLNNETPEYLLLHHTAGHWGFPKGRFEPGETMHEAALRELQEETGIAAVKVKNGFLETVTYNVNLYEGGIAPKDVFLFLGEVPSKKVTISDEHTEFVWLPLAGASKQLHRDKHSDDFITVLKKADAFINKNNSTHKSSCCC
jgi:8-oxo-dGTP pyrophosphatase MutT (NUDIX family)